MKMRNYFYTFSCIYALPNYGFYVVENNGWVEIFFCSSCGTLIWVRIIPVKVDQSLTGIIRTFIIIYVVDLFLQTGRSCLRHFCLIAGDFFCN